MENEFVKNKLEEDDVGVTTEDGHVGWFFCCGYSETSSTIGAKINTLRKSNSELKALMGIDNQKWIILEKYIGDKVSDSNFQCLSDECNAIKRKVRVNVAQMRSNEILVLEFGVELKDEISL